MEYIHRGTWIKPTYKRDFSQLGSNKSGFLTVSGDMRIAKGEKHSVTGKWNMMGFNDDVRLRCSCVLACDKHQLTIFIAVRMVLLSVIQIVRGRKKKIDDGPGGKGQYQIYVRTIKGVRFPINAIPSNKISQVKKKIHQKKGIPIQDQMLSFKDVPLKDDKTVCK
jgi:hypothetical protein